MKSNSKLNTGWKHWDKFLSKFVGKKINCLDIGSFEGASTCWMLNNLCSNPFSRVFSIDTWDGGPDYTANTNFRQIESTFDYNVGKTGRTNQHVKMKMTSSEALIQLRAEKYIFFDFIFIDASHEAKDVLSDAILSWELLVEDGIMIFDDYMWDKLNKDYFCPKVAIDSFNYIFTPQLDILFKGYQCIVRKKKMHGYEKPESGELYKLIDDANYFKFYEFDVIFDDVIDGDNFEYNLRMEKLPNDDKLKQITYKELNLISDKIEQFFNVLVDCDKVEIYNFYHLFNVEEPFDVINNTLVKKFKKEINNANLFKNIKYFNIFVKKNFLCPVIKFAKERNFSDVCLLLRYTLDIDEFKNEMKNLFNCSINAKIFTTLESDKKMNGVHNINFENYNDLQNIIDICSGTNTKFDLFYSRVLIQKSVRKHIFEKKNIFSVELLCKIFLCLSLQKIHGNCILFVPIYITDVFFELIMILKKHYEQITISKSNDAIERYYGILIMIKCKNFLGIEPDSLEKLKNVIIKISNENKNFTDFEKSSHLDLKNILNLNDNQKKIMEQFKYKFINKIEMVAECAKSYYNLLYRVKKYIDENKSNHENKNYMLENIIYKKQISEFIYSLNLILNLK